MSCISPWFSGSEPAAVARYVSLLQDVLEPLQAPHSTG